VKACPSWATPSKNIPLKKISILKVVRPKAKPGLRGMLEIELVSKKFYLLDLPGSSHGPHDEDRVVNKVHECTARVMAFDNLGNDSSPDIQRAPSPRVTEKVPPPPPSFMPGEFVCYTIIL
jgi:hypothetical protein